MIAVLIMRSSDILFLRSGLSKKPDKSNFFVLESELWAEIQTGAIGKEAALWEQLATYGIARHLQQRAEVLDLLDCKFITLLFR